MDSFTRWFIDWFINSFIQLFLHSLTHSFTNSSIYSYFIHSSIHLFTAYIYTPYNWLHGDAQLERGTVLDSRYGKGRVLFQVGGMWKGYLFGGKYGKRCQFSKISMWMGANLWNVVCARVLIFQNLVCERVRSPDLRQRIPIWNWSRYPLTPHPPVSRPGKLKNNISRLYRFSRARTNPNTC